MRITETIDEEKTIDSKHTVGIAIKIGKRIIWVDGFRFINEYEIQTIYFNLDCIIKGIRLIDSVHSAIRDDCHHNIKMREGEIIQFNIDPSWIT